MAPRKKAVTNEITKKSPVKKTTSIKTTPLKLSVTKESSTSPIKKSYALITVVIIILALLLYLNRGFFVAAMINGKPILRTSVIQELERQGGKQTLDSLITEELIRQEAQKQHVIVSDKEIQDETKKIEDNVKKQGQSLDSVLTSQKMTRDNLKEKIKLQKLVEKMVGKDITVTDKEVQDYIDKNKDSIPAGGDAQKIKDAIKEQIKQGKLSEKVQSWLSNLQKNAKIIYLIHY